MNDSKKQKAEAEFQAEEQRIGDSTPQLKDGVVGSQIVKYFENFGKVAVDASSLGGTPGTDKMHYRITFEDGDVTDYEVTFSKDFKFHVLMAAPIVEDWFAMLDRAKALGKQYADNGIAGGETMPQDAPLSGEWAGAILPKDVVEQLGGDYDALEGWEVTDILDHWEDGYNSAEWPERPEED